MPDKSSHCETLVQPQKHERVSLHGRQKGFEALVVSPAFFAFGMLSFEHAQSPLLEPRICWKSFDLSFHEQRQGNRKWSGLRIEPRTCAQIGQNGSIDFYHFLRHFGNSLTDLGIGSDFFRSGCPAWIRTMTRRVKVACAAITPPGKEVSEGSTLLHPPCRSRQETTAGSRSA